MEGRSMKDILFLTLSHNITIVGKVWLVQLLLLRVPVLMLAAYPLHLDERERFVCNTIQPGCADVCYDAFYPLSLPRFWLLQLISLCLLYAVFVVYVVHRVSADLCMESVPPGETPARGLASFRKSCALWAERNQGWSFGRAYVVQLWLRILLEAGFGVAHYGLFGLHIPKKFLCHELPCTSMAECFTSRPSEKTLLLNFTLGVSASSLLLSVADLICAIRCSARRRSETEALEKRTYEDEEEEEEEEEDYYLSPKDYLSGRKVDTHLPLSHGLETAAAIRKRGDSQCCAEEAVSARLLEAGCSTIGPSDHSKAEPPSNTNGNNAHTRDRMEGLDLDGRRTELLMSDPTKPSRLARPLLGPPPSPRQRGHLMGTPTAPRSRASSQYTLVDTLDLQSNSSDPPEKRAWV